MRYILGMAFRNAVWKIVGLFIIGALLSYVLIVAFYPGSYLLLPALFVSAMSSVFLAFVDFLWTIMESVVRVNKVIRVIMGVEFDEVAKILFHYNYELGDDSEKWNKTFYADYGEYKRRGLI